MLAWRDHCRVLNELLITLGIGLALALIWIASRYQGQQRRRFFALIILVFISIVFWSIYAQIYLSINSEDFDFKTDSKLVPFLKSHGFKKAALLILNAGNFEIEKHFGFVFRPVR